MAYRHERQGDERAHHHVHPDQCQQDGLARPLQAPAPSPSPPPAARCQGEHRGDQRREAGRSPRQQQGDHHEHRQRSGDEPDRPPLRAATLRRSSTSHTAVSGCIMPSQRQHRAGVAGLLRLEVFAEGQLRPAVHCRQTMFGAPMIIAAAMPSSTGRETSKRRAR